MAHAFTPGLQVKKNVFLQRTRELPIPGEVLVQAGDHVCADTVVARAEMPGDLLILRIPEALGIEPFEVEQGLKIAAGAAVQTGEVLCEHVGMFGLLKSRFYSPAQGIIEFVSDRTGHVGLRLAAKPLELYAYIQGTVAKIEPRKSVVIETNGAFVQGIFGVGGERFGVLRVIKSGAVVIPSDIPADCLGNILVVAGTPSGAALHTAAEKGAVGFVAGSLDDAALMDYLGYEIGIALTGDENVSMSIMLTEGFGCLAMAQRTFDLFCALNGRQSSLNGATQVRAGAVRPEVIVADAGLLSVDVAAEVSPGLKLGSHVRLIRVPLFGLTAEVVELPPAPERIDTGAIVRVLRARLQDGNIVTVPRANVELVD
jgi:hypothetical protein